MYLARSNSPHQVERTALPAVTDAFCWTRYGTESGEPIANILARKSEEVEANGGRFIWGIGNSIRPSLPALLARNPRPLVRFSAMVSPARQQDIRPERVRVWQSGRDWEGRYYRLPQHSVVTSNGDVARNTHFALVCEAEGPLVETAQPLLYAGELRNLIRGSRVGASQVTAVVSQSPRANAPGGAVYSRGFTARLVPPYFVTLTQSISIPTSEANTQTLRAARSVRPHPIDVARYLPGF